MNQTLTPAAPVSLNQLAAQSQLMEWQLQDEMSRLNAMTCSSFFADDVDGTPSTEVSDSNSSFHQGYPSCCSEQGDINGSSDKFNAIEVSVTSGKKRIPEPKSLETLMDIASQTIYQQTTVQTMSPQTMAQPGVNAFSDVSIPEELVVLTSSTQAHYDSSSAQYEATGSVVSTCDVRQNMPSERTVYKVDNESGKQNRHNSVDEYTKDHDQDALREEPGASWMPDLFVNLLGFRWPLAYLGAMALTGGLGVLFFATMLNKPEYLNTGYAVVFSGLAGLALSAGLSALNLMFGLMFAPAAINTTAALAGVALDDTGMDSNCGHIPPASVDALASLQDEVAKLQSVIQKMHSR